MKTLQKMFDHLHWANQLILETFQNGCGDKKEAVRLFSHILYAEKVWITRLLGLNSSKLPLWLDTSIDVCDELVTQNKESFTTFFVNLTEADLEKIVTYKNSTGAEFKNTVREILTHVALHGQYHRGQINTYLRSDGIEPINVDFITFVR